MLIKNCLHVYTKVCTVLCTYIMQDGPISCTTVFNESILGPIQKHNNRKGKPLSNEAMAAVPEPSERGTVGDSQGGCGASGMQSAFEKMMNTFGAFEKTIEKPAQPQSSVNKEGLVKGVLPQGLCDSSEVMVLGRRGGRMEGESRGGYGGQDRKWQDFTSGFTKELHQDTQHDTAVVSETIDWSTYLPLYIVNAYIMYIYIYIWSRPCSTKSGSNLSMNHLEPWAANLQPAAILLVYVIYYREYE